MECFLFLEGDRKSQLRILQSVMQVLTNFISLFSLKSSDDMKRILEEERELIEFPFAVTTIEDIDSRRSENSK